MKVPYKIEGHTFDIPNSWADVTVAQFLRLAKAMPDKTGGAPATETSIDFMACLEAISGVPRAIWENTRQSDIETVLLPNLKWMQVPLNLNDCKKPEKVVVAGKEVTVPTDLASETFGQKISIEEMLLKVKEAPNQNLAIVNNIPMATAVYLYPLATGLPYSDKEARDFCRHTEQLPIMQAYPLTAFFLKRWLDLSEQKANASDLNQLLNSAVQASEILKNSAASPRWIRWLAGKFGNMNRWNARRIK